MSIGRRIGHGARLGALTGMILAGAYAALTMAAFGIIAMTGSMTSGGGLFALPLLGGVAFCGWPFAILLGLLPGILVGALGGALTGGLLSALPRLSPWAAPLPGALVGLAIALANALLLGPGFLADHAAGRSSLFPYFFWIVGPGLLLVMGAGWVSSRINRL